MINQVLLPGEWFIAHIATMRILAGMLSQVIRKMFLSCKSLLAEFTSMRRISRMYSAPEAYAFYFIVKKNLLLQIFLSQKKKWNSPNVISQMLLPRERLHTKCTTMGWFSSMLTHMICQMFLSCEALGTVGALVWRFTRMLSHVIYWNKQQIFL